MLAKQDTHKEIERNDIPAMLLPMGDAPSSFGRCVVVIFELPTGKARWYLIVRNGGNRLVARCWAYHSFSRSSGKRFSNLGC